ncbi:MAG: alkyl hydroperoxide reductase/Thiol specific antioxidant/Mal allergen [Actinomycetia bacterium]|nr:alkyl hydroperoxide reductase/Thiol specific antioxidant/Mal allergen [Actinomycetes bacterium]
MRKVLTLLCLVAALAGGGAALAGCGTGKDAVDQSAGSQNRFVAGNGSRTDVPVGTRADPPKVTGETLDGKSFDLASLRGKVVVVNFWGSWCAPCRAEADDLEAVYTATRDQGVEFVGVNVKDSQDNAKAFERTFHISYPSLFDPSMRVALAFPKTPPNGVPATVVLDRTGRVAVVARTPLVKDELRDLVDRVVAEKK